MMKKNITWIIVIINITFGCNKKAPQYVSIKDDINNLFDLTKYQQTHRKKINDSILIFEGRNRQFKIVGRYNFSKNYKIGWWRSYDIINAEKYLDVEFYKEIDKQQEFNNQIIFYKNNTIDTLNSKFFIRDRINKHSFLYTFYFPKNLDKLKSAKVNLAIVSEDRPLLYPTDFKSKIVRKGFYNYLLDISKYRENKTLNVVGLFSEFSISEKEKRLGVNEIFIDDTVNVE